MNKLTEGWGWFRHLATSIIASGTIFGLVETFVPPGYKAYALALVPVVGYALGLAQVPPSPK